MITHKDEDTYQNQTYKVKFSNNGDIIEHMIVHTGENKYQCTVCDKVFLHNSDLLQH